MMMYCCISLAEWHMWDPRCLFLEICLRISYASAQLFLWATISQYRGYVWYCQDDSMVTDNMDKMQSCAIWILNSSVSATRKKILNLTTYLFSLGICPYKHWTKSLVLTVINAKNCEIQVIDSLGLVHRDELIYVVSIILIYIPYTIRHSGSYSYKVTLTVFWQVQGLQR